MPYANLGIVNSWGWELGVKWNDKIGDNFRYWASVNLSHNQNEIIEKKEAPLNNEYQYEKGHRLGSRYMYQFFRYYDSDTPRLYQEAFGQPYHEQLVELKDGEAVFVDLDGDGNTEGSLLGGKTGFTDEAGFALETIYKYNKKNYICITTKSTSDFNSVADNLAIYENYIKK